MGMEARQLPIGRESARPPRPELAPVRHARRAVEPGLLYDVTIRAIDVVVSLLALLVLSPLLAVIAVLIRIDSPGPVLFRQVRIGRNRRKSPSCRPRQRERRVEDRFGRPFVLYKFRSMYADARERFPDLYSYDHSDEEMRTLPIKVLVGQKLQFQDGEGDRRFADDPRVTPLGGWLRRTSFDELPNFFNVLKGDMHLVGPRPDIAENIRYYPESHMRKLDVKPGITGLAQVSGRGKLSFFQTNEYDVQYVDSRSVWTDLRILFRTLVVCFTREGAF